VAKFTKGHKKLGGKQRGAQNKATKDIKLAFQNLIENNLDNMTKWLEQVAATDPSKALILVKDLSEFIVPKLARQEMTGKDGTDLIPFNITVRDTETSQEIKKLEND